VRNLAALVPRWRRRFPRLRLILENLNPRHGYGGIVFQDVVDIAAELGGEVGICLDVGHLTLAEAALGVDMSESVAAARDLIWSVHLHQNFAGRYCIDRHGSDALPRPLLQDVDCHLPFEATMWRGATPGGWVVGRENAAFLGVLEGPVQYVPSPGALPVRGAVDLERWLSKVGAETQLVLELDARYVPLDDVLASYAKFQGRPAVEARA